MLEYDHKTNPVDIDMILTSSRIRDWLIKYPKLARLLKLGDLGALFNRINADVRETGFCQKLVDQMKVQYQIVSGQLNNIPKTGGLVVIANHVYGMLDGALLVALMKRVRANVKIIINRSLHRLNQATDEFLMVNPYIETGTTQRDNMRALRDAIHWLKQGNTLVIFPAGEVTYFQWRKMRFTDPPWQTTVAKIIHKTQANILPIYIDSRNSNWFQFLSMFHPRLGSLRLGAELMNKYGKIVPLHIRDPLAYEKIQAIHDPHQLLHYLRNQTYQRKN